MAYQHTFKLEKHSDKLKTYAEEKMSHVEKFLMKEGHIHFHYSKKRYMCVVEVTVSSTQYYFKAHSEMDDFFASIDDVCHKLEKQLGKVKNKVKHHKNFEKSKEGRLQLVNPYMEYDGAPAGSKKTA